MSTAILNQPVQVSSNESVAPSKPKIRGRRRFKKTWKELSLAARVAIVREAKERSETVEARAIASALNEASERRKQKETKMAKLRSFLLAKRPEASPKLAPAT